MKKNEIGIVVAIVAVYSAVAVVSAWIGRIFGTWVGKKIIEMTEGEK